VPNPNDPPKGGARRVGVIVLVLLAAAAGAILALRRPPRAGTVSASAPRPGELPRDPLAYVPASARTLVVADLARLRSAPATRGWFAEAGGAPSCQEAIARRVRTVALVIPRLPPDDFAFVAAGDLSPADLARCAPGAEPVTREGFTLTAVRSRRDGGGVGGVVAWTPQGVVLVGSSTVVDAMLDRAIDVARGHASQPALDPLRPLVAPEAAVWALHLADGNAPPNDPLAAVSAGALSVTVSDAVRADATLRCDDGAHARRLEETLGRVRNEAARELTDAHLRAALEGAAVSTEGADVRVRAALSAEVTAAVGEAVSGLARRAAGALGAP